MLTSVPKYTGVSTAPLSREPGGICSSTWDPCNCCRHADVVLPLQGGRVSPCITTEYPGSCTMTLAGGLRAVLRAPPQDHVTHMHGGNQEGLRGARSSPGVAQGPETPAPKAVFQRHRQFLNLRPSSAVSWCGSASGPSRPSPHVQRRYVWLASPTEGQHALRHVYVVHHEACASAPSSSPALTP